MEMYKIFAALMLGGAVVACSGSAPAAKSEDGVPAVKTAKDYLPSKAQKDSVSYLLGINFGSFMKNYNFGDDLNYSVIVAGIKDYMKSEGSPYDENFTKQFKYDPNDMNAVFSAYLEGRVQYIALINKEKEEKWFAENAKKAGVQQTESGLQYEIIEAGSDVKPVEADTVYVHYKGTLTDGTVFDEVAEDAEAISFPLSGVVSGWREGLQLIGEGGHVKLYIPSALGYGERGAGTIPPYSTLVFDVKLDKVGKAAAAASEK